MFTQVDQTALGDFTVPRGAIERMRVSLPLPTHPHVAVRQVSGGGDDDVAVDALAGTKYQSGQPDLHLCGRATGDMLLRPDVTRRIFGPGDHGEIRVLLDIAPTALQHYSTGPGGNQC